MKNLSHFYTELGKLIRAHRQSQKLSLEELAYRCGLHLNAVWKIEKARGDVKLTTLIKIFKELHINFSLLQELVNQSTN